MFTGIVYPGILHTREARPGDAARLVVGAGELGREVAIGDSVAVNGCCLTAVAVEGDRVSFDCIAETMRLTSLGELEEGRRVNLELAMRASDRLGGHFVSGHIDGTGTIARTEEASGEWVLEVSCDKALTDQCVLKGSITLDGVSLTLTRVEDGLVGVALIPHTLDVTNLGEKGVGQRINIETDLIGKYVQRYLALTG